MVKNWERFWTLPHNLSSRASMGSSTKQPKNNRRMAGEAVEGGGGGETTVALSKRVMSPRRTQSITRRNHSFKRNQDIEVQISNSPRSASVAPCPSPSNATAVWVSASPRKDNGRGFLLRKGRCGWERKRWNLGDLFFLFYFCAVLFMLVFVTIWAATGLFFGGAHQVSFFLLLSDWWDFASSS